jgi:hypothetical protein
MWYYRYMPLKPNRENEEWTQWYPLVEFVFVTYNTAQVEFKKF